MLKNYLTVALRTLRRNKGYAAINVGGLAAGLAACLLIGLWVRHELSYDDFHEKADRIYRVTTDLERPDGSTTRLAVSSARVGRALRARYPEAERVVRINSWREPVVEKNGRRFTGNDFFFADSTFFEVFSFSLARGDAETALDAPYSMVLTPEAKQRYFGDQSALGQSFVAGDSLRFTVTGVLKDTPTNSHLSFDGLASGATLPSLRPDYGESWRSLSMWNYVLLRPGASASAFEEKISGLIERNQTGHSKTVLGLQPLTDIYLRSDRFGDIGPTGSITYVWAFSIIALFIALLACINYANLTTARATQRAREVGVRKAAGARREQLAAQFLAESVLVVLAALLAGLALAGAALPFFSQIAGKELSLTSLVGGTELLALVGILLGVSLLAGGYPALVLSGFSPAEVLSGGRGASGTRGARLRQGLVTLQFTVSVALIAGTLVVFQQLRYMRGQDLGFDKEHVVVVDAQNALGQAAPRRYEAIKRELRQLPNVRSVAAAGAVPGEGPSGTRPARPPGASEKEGIAVNLTDIGHDFTETLGIDMAAGRSFSKGFSSDERRGLLINEKAAQELGWTAEEAVGKQLEVEGWEANEVIGVMENYHQESLKQPIEPRVFAIRPEGFNYFAVRTGTGDVSETLAGLEETWGQLFPGSPFETFFLDQEFAEEYRAERRQANIFGAFAALAVFIACLGLFGLAAFAAERRRKEIAVRKTFGASVGQLVGLLSKDFLKLVVVGFVLAAPVAYFAMRRWLEGFAYRVELGPLVFLAAGALALVVALAATGTQALKAARTNPAQALRDE